MSEATVGATRCETAGPTGGCLFVMVMASQHPVIGVLGNWDEGIRTNKVGHAPPLTVTHPTNPAQITSVAHPAAQIPKTY